MSEDATEKKASREILVRIPVFDQQLAQEVRDQGTLLARLDERFKGMDERLERMDHDLFGNGKPGKLSEMEDDIKDSCDRVDVLEKADSHMKGWVAGVVGVGLFIGGLAEFIAHVKGH